MPDGEEDVCVVCMESLASEHVHTMDGCGHCFHSKCIIEWMQRGHLNCPTCRGSLRHQENAIPHMALHERARHIRRTLGRRRNVPNDLRRLLARVRAAEEAERDVKRAEREFRREHGSVIQQYRSFRTRRWSMSRRTRAAERLLGLYQAPGYQLPGLMVQPLHY